MVVGNSTKSDGATTPCPVRADTRRLNQKIQYISDVLYFFIVSALRRDLRVGAVLREQNALPYKAWKNAEFAGKVRR